MAIGVVPVVLLAVFSSLASANPLGGVAAVSAGELHTCALTTEGGVKCWGFGGEGQLGDGQGTFDEQSNMPRLSPTPVDVVGLGADTVALSAGFNHTCVLSVNGDVLCWGDNVYGQLGNGSGSRSDVPVRVEGLEGPVALGAGGYHTCAVTSGGDITCWGRNWSGQLGNGSLGSSSAPVEVRGLTGPAVAVDAGQDHTCAVLEQGDVWCWGSNQFGQLGDGTATDRLVPVAVVGLHDAVAVAAAATSTCALTEAGGVRCWGDRYGNTPADLPQLTDGVVGLAAGPHHVCGVLGSGGALCWGANNFGQLGDGRQCGSAVCAAPVDVAGLASGVAAVSAGVYHTCAATAGGGAKCWGNNYAGQLGNGLSGRGTVSTTPVDVTESEAKPTPTPTPCPPEGCPTPVRPEPPRTGLDFSIAVDAGGDGIDDCSTRDGDSACSLSPGSTFDVRVDLNALPPGLESYEGFDAVMYYAGVGSNEKSIAVWPDCGFPASYHDERLAAVGCAAPIGGSSTFVGPIATSEFTCAGNGSVVLAHGRGNTALHENQYVAYYEAGGAGEALIVNCGPPLHGDVDCDAVVSAVDATLLLQRGARLLAWLSCPQHADVNLDNGVNAVDAAIVLQYTAELVAGLPPQAYR